jgi:hypothetical protein
MWITENTIMGMDVYGKDASSEVGEYFRANCWSWRPIHLAIWECASDIIDADVIDQMACNDGAGLDTQDQCNELADRLEAWMQVEIPDEDIFQPDQYNDPEFQVTENGQFLGKDQTVMKDGKRVPYEGETHSPYVVHKEHLEEFVGFLRQCGGFEVF